MAAPGGGFPATRHSVLEGVRSPERAVRERAFGTLVAAYWKPVYKYLRLKWQAAPEDAEDLTQGFFARAYEKSFFDRYDPSRARFRTFLRTCLDAFVANQRKAARRLKRGGGAPLASLDFSSAEGELGPQPADPGDLEAFFHAEWVQAVFALAVERLRLRCREAGRDADFTLFARYDLEDDEAAGRTAAGRLTYAQIGHDLGLSASQVTNRLAAARRDFRAIVLDTLRELTGSEDEFRAEARQLLGVEPRRVER